MSHNDTSRRVPADPHGYQPIIIDEDCLTAEDRTEEVMNSLASIADPTLRHRMQDLKSVMTPAEQEVCARPPVKDSAFRIGNYSAEQEEEKCAIAVQAARRAYAREKYANGQSVWYGDGLPYARQGG